MPVRGRGYSYRDRFRLKNRLLRLTVTYIVIAAAVSFGVLFVLNGNASAAAAQQTPQPTPTATPAPTATPTPTSPYTSKLTGVPQDAKEFYFSYDGIYMAYRTATGFVVMDTQANRALKTVDDPNIQWMQFIDNRDIVLYLTLEGNSVVANTYNIGSDVQAKQQASFKVPADSKVKSAAFSNARNYLCVNVETGTDSFSDEVYAVDNMKQTTRLTLQDIINNLVLLNRTDQVYYTNSKGTLFFGNKSVSGLEAGTLIGRDDKDKVYFQAASNRGTVYVLADGKLENTLNLPDVTDLLTFWNTHSAVYAVYDGFLVNLSGNAAAQIPFDKALDFIGIGGKNVFFRNVAGEVLAVTLPG